MATVRRTHGPAADHPVGGEIRLGDAAAALVHGGRDAASELAPVEGVGALPREQLERARELLHHHAAAGRERPVPSVDAPAVRIVPENSVEDHVQGGLRGVQLDASARRLDRRSQQLRPGHRAVEPVGLGQAGHGAGNGAGSGADQERLGRAAASEGDVHELHLRG